MLIKSLSSIKAKVVVTSDSHVMLITEENMLYHWGVVCMVALVMVLYNTRLLLHM